MFVSPLRCCGSIKNINGVLAIGIGSIEQIVTCIGRVHYTCDKGKYGKCNCCKEVSPTKSQNVEITNYRRNEGQELPTINYDPYRIKVAEVTVPPLPPSTAKPAFECVKIDTYLTPIPQESVPPPIPPPPPPSFPWIFVYITGTCFTIMGMMYKLYCMESEPIWQPRPKLKRPFHANQLPRSVQYLIVGTGAAGWSAYQAIMKYDKNAKVFFISKEDALPYNRVPISKHMWWNDEPPNIDKLEYVENGRKYSMLREHSFKFMDLPSFCRKTKGPALSIATGWNVKRVDADEHIVYVQTKSGERPISYKRCLLAPGSKPKNLNLFHTAPKTVRDKVCTLNTIRDLEYAFRRVRESKHVVILGGGTLGTELAWHLGKMNELVKRPPKTEPIEFVHIFKERGIMVGILPEYLAAWGAEKIRSKNVTVMPQTQVYDAFLTPDGRLELTLSDGSSLVTDCVMVAIGAEPCTEMAEPSFLETDDINGGFKVNTELEARKDLYIAGDAASIFSQWHGKRLRFQHNDNAQETGSIAGANMAGNWYTCNMEPHFWLRLGHELEIEVIGEVGTHMPTIGLFKPCSEEIMSQVTTVAAGAGDQTCSHNMSENYKERYQRGMLFYLRDEVIVGVVLLNIKPVADRKAVVTEIIRARPTYKEIDAIAGLLGFSESDSALFTTTEAKELQHSATK